MLITNWPTPIASWPISTTWTPKLDGDGAKGEDTRQHALDEHLVYLTNAKDEFQKLAELLDRPEGQGLLKLEEQVQVPVLLRRLPVSTSANIPTLCRRIRRWPDAIRPAVWKV